MSREEDGAVALVRVYCGLASADPATPPPGAETWLTVAVVDDAGRLLDICDISDDAAGYAELGALLAERSSGPASVAVAADTDEHVVTRLLTAAGRYLAYTDEDSADDYAERFADDDSAEEIQSSPAERRAVGHARALQAGVLSAVPQASPRDLLSLKPVLAAHTAVIGGRQGAAATLREVLRELYPAALRAYPDPAEPVPLAVLDALPEPGLLGTGTAARSREVPVIAELIEAGVADAETVSEAVTALRVAVAETPRRTGMTRSVTSAVAETIRQAVSSVRSCDAAAAALVSVLADRMSSTSTAARRPSGSSRSRATQAPPPVVSAQPSTAPLRAVRDPGEPLRRRNGRQQPSRTEAPAARIDAPAAAMPPPAAPVSPPPAAPVSPPPAAPVSP